MSGFEEKLAKNLSQGQDYRDAYSEAFSNEYLAAQIQVLRKQRGWTQAQLGEKIGSNQGRVSVYEDEEYGKWSLETLRKMAAVFGLWVKVSFESHGTLVHEATHFQPQKLLRNGFEEDAEIRRWLELDEPASREEKTLRMIARWARAKQPDRSELAGWLQGFGLPDFDVRESTPVQQLPESIPECEDGIWSVLARESAGLMTADENEIAPLVRTLSVFRESLFGLAKALGPRAEIRDGLQVVYDRAWRRFELEGWSGLGVEGEEGLLDAMIHNQLDGRWKEIWDGYLTGATHLFLPGKTRTGLQGLLGMPETPGYWREMARGIRDLERTFMKTRRDQLDITLDVMSELTKAVGVVFDSWGDAKSAQQLLRGSIDLIGAGSWGMYAQAAWAYGVRKRGWLQAVRVAEEMERGTFANAIASGLKFYKEWLLAWSAKINQELTRLQQEEIEGLEEDSQEASLVVMGKAVA